MNIKGQIKDWFFGTIALMVILIFLYFFLPTLIGIASAFLVHVLVFTKIDLLHELHHHHSEKGHGNHTGNHLKL